MQKLDVEYRAEHPNEHPTTTADEGASIEDVKAGMKEVEAAKQVQEVPEVPVQTEPVPVPPTTVP